MEFLAWHYTYALNYYILRLKNTVLSINHQLSLPLLLPTLFAPWKRLSASTDRPGIHPIQDLQELSFNMISRAIGAVARIVVLIVGVFVIIFLFAGGAVGFLLWLVLPFLSLSIYRVYKRQPIFVMQDLTHNTLALSRNHLFSSEAGHFLLTHLGNEKVKTLFPEQMKLAQKEHAWFFDLMSDVLRENPIDEAHLRALQIKKEDILLAAKWWDQRRTNNTTLTPKLVFQQPGIGMSLLFGYTPTLDKYVSDMGLPREFTHHLIGREETVSRMVRVLTAGRGVMLTGVPGVGKKTVVYEFAKRAREGLLGKEMSYKRILDFDYNALMSGSHDINAKKTLFLQILKEAESAGNVILVIRDIHKLTNSEIEGMDLTDILTQALENKRLYVMSILDKHDYDRFVSRNDRLNKFFEEVQVNEITIDEAMSVLLSAARYSEKRRHIMTPVPVMRDILAGSAQYLTDTPFPEKALELLDALMLYHEEHNLDGPISRNEVQAVLSEKTGIALSSLGDAEKDKLSHLEEIIHRRLVNQEYPVMLLSKALRAKTSGVVKNNRPVGSFLFLGPTGVGKTETAKALADVYFGSEKRIVRFDMSEYAGNEGIERLIGSVSKNMPGTLTTNLKNHPASLLLLDEIEKAPKEVFNLFLSLLDEGRITDAFGRSVSATHTFIIATSNAGSEYIRELMKSPIDKETLQKEVLNKVLQDRVFSPEFLNRFDGVVVYEPLSKEHLMEVAKRQLGFVTEQMKEKGIQITFDESVITKVVEEGYDPALGARPMRRMIELKVGDVIAQSMLAGKIADGDAIILKADTSTNGFMWEKQ